MLCCAAATKKIVHTYNVRGYPAAHHACIRGSDRAGESHARAPPNRHDLGKAIYLSLETFVQLK